MYGRGNVITKVLEEESTQRAMRTPRTCWEYIRQVKFATEASRCTFTALDANGPYPVSPRWLYASADLPRQQDVDRVSHFEWLKRTFGFSPTFHWLDHMHGGHVSSSSQALQNMAYDERKKDTQLCRSLFNEMKDAGFPIRLLVSADHDDLVKGDSGTFCS